jgi:hypothetical protein
MRIKNNNLLGALKMLILFVVFLGGIHLLLLDYILPASYFQLQLIYAYLFLGGLSTLGIGAMFLIKKNDEGMIGNGFLVYTMLKIFASVGFLLPWLTDQNEFTMPFVYQFFAVFFPLLFVETLIIVRLTNSIARENIEANQNQLKK